MNIKELVGSGEKIGLTTLPFIAIGLILNYLYPSFFSVGGPSEMLRLAAVLMLIPGVIIWLWSVVLILTQVPKKKLITNGPYALVKHPLYTGVSLLVIPAVGILLDSWLGIAIGLVVYFASRKFSPDEEKILSKAFGVEWEKYGNKVMFPWL